MKPYYEHAGITIYHGDCRDVLPTLRDFNMTLADPPYNVGLAYGRGFVDSMPLDEYRRFNREWFCHCFARGTVLITPGTSNLSYWATLDPSWFYCWTTASNTPGGRAAMRLGWEPLVAFGFPKKPFGTDVLNYAIRVQEGVGQHPCPKPMGLFKTCIERFSEEYETVLDPFMGSGTTLRAAKDLGRRAIGIEIEERYCEIAAKRMEQEVFQFTD